MNTNRQDEIIKNIEFSIEDQVKRYIEKLANPNLLQEKIRPRLWGHLESLAIIRYYKHKDIIGVKNAFYNLAKIDLYSSKKYGNFNFLKTDISLYHLTYTLLSDSDIIIDQYLGTFGDSEFISPNECSLFYVLVNILKDNKKTLLHQFENLNRQSQSNQLIKMWSQEITTYIDGWLNEDKEQIKQSLFALNSKSNPSKMESQFGYAGAFFGCPILAFTKVAWIKGIEVEMDSPLVPIDLLRVNPNDTYYDEYNFLKELDDPSMVTSKLKKEIIFKESGSYPEENPTLRSAFVNPMTVSKAVKHFCPNHSQRERDLLTAFIWEAYTDPRQFDLKHAEYVRKYASWELERKENLIIKESRPFWSELTVYDDEGFFRYCVHFIIMNEMNIDHNDVEAFLEELKSHMV